jgi:hypothetical protein
VDVVVDLDVDFDGDGDGVRGRPFGGRFRTSWSASQRRPPRG